MTWSLVTHRPPPRQPGIAPQGPPDGRPRATQPFGDGDQRRATLRVHLDDLAVEELPGLAKLDAVSHVAPPVPMRDSSAVRHSGSIMVFQRPRSGFSARTVVRIASRFGFRQGFPGRTEPLLSLPIANLTGIGLRSRPRCRRGGLGLGAVPGLRLDLGILDRLENVRPERFRRDFLGPGSPSHVRQLFRAGRPNRAVLGRSRAWGGSHHDGGSVRAPRRPERSRIASPSSRPYRLRSGTCLCMRPRPRRACQLHPWIR